MTSLYRHFDKDGALLYVGVSFNPFVRSQGHSNGSVWFERISRIEIEQFETRDAALDAEFNAIQKERPLYNKAGQRFDIPATPNKGMSGRELASIRRTLCGTNTGAFGRALGYAGNDATLAASVRRLEIMEKVPGSIAKLASIYRCNNSLLTEDQLPIDNA